MATVRVTAGSSGTNGWAATVTLPSGTAVTNAWNAQSSGTTGTVRFANVAYNGRLTGRSTSRFQGVGTPPAGTPSCTAS